MNSSNGPAIRALLAFALASALLLPQMACEPEEKAARVEIPFISVHASAAGSAKESEAAEGAASPAASLYVYVGHDGVTFVQGEPLLLDGKILARAEAFHTKNPQGRVIVQSHQAAVHGRTVRVLELLQEAEIRHVAVRVQR